MEITDKTDKKTEEKEEKKIEKIEENTEEKIEEIQKIKERSFFTRKIIDVKELNNILKEGSNHGICGNIKKANNTFLDSSLACLSNCTELTTYFLTEQYKSDIKSSNSEALSGNLAIAWKNLLDIYWNSNENKGNPEQIKSTIIQKTNSFKRNYEYDVNKFISVFLYTLNK